LIDRFAIVRASLADELRNQLAIIALISSAAPPPEFELFIDVLRASDARAPRPAWRNWMCDVDCPASHKERARSVSTQPPSCVWLLVTKIALQVQSWLWPNG